MILQNFDHHIEALMLMTKSLSTDIEVAGSGTDVTVKTTSGSTIKCPTGIGNSSGWCAGACPLSESNLVIGDGDAPVTYGDFKLAGNTFGSTFTKVSSDVVFDEDSRCWVRTLTVKYSNTKDTDFVVKEWGIWRGRDGTSASLTYTNNSFIILVYREVLDEPITIAANSTATLTFTLKIPHEMNAF